MSDAPSDSGHENEGILRLRWNSPDPEKRQQAAGIYVRHFYERLPWADCWYQVYPSAPPVSRKVAGVRAIRLAAWLRRNYPLDIDNQMEAHGLGKADMLEKLRRLAKATTRVKVGEKYDLDDQGRMVGKRFVFEHDQDNRALDAALGKQMSMHGHGAGASRKPLAEERKTIEGERRLLEEPEDMPRTVEEALERGEPMTVIEHPEDMPPDQWAREWEAYQEERRREEREQGPL